MPGIPGTRVYPADVEQMLGVPPHIVELPPDIATPAIGGEWYKSTIAWPLEHGEHCAIWAYTVIEGDVMLGDGVVIGSHCFIGRGTTIGSETHLQSRVFLPRHTSIGKRVFIGPGVIVCDDKYPARELIYYPEPPTIHDEVSIGAGAIIGPGVTLHAGCQVGMGAVVTRDVAAGMLVYGNPAREHGQRKRITYG